VNTARKSIETGLSPGSSYGDSPMFRTGRSVSGPQHLDVRLDEVAVYFDPNAIGQGGKK
jgi:hypothetical protein